MILLTTKTSDETLIIGVGGAGLSPEAGRLLTIFDGGLFSFSHRTFASDSILMKPLNFILLSHLLNKNIFRNCVEKMKNCRD